MPCEEEKLLLVLVVVTCFTSSFSLSLTFRLLSPVEAEDKFDCWSLFVDEIVQDYCTGYYIG